MIASFLSFLALFVLVGISSFFVSRKTPNDYYLASSSIPAWLVGLSAVATNNSGYMFIGVIGFTYTTGLSSIWLMIGWIAGDFLTSLFVHAKLRQSCGSSNELSYAGVISHWNGLFRYKSLQKVIALVSIIFLLAYASAQLMAGGKALQVLFNWQSWSGAVITASIVLAYCLAGGIRASIWTDAAQSFVMIIAMGVLLFTTVNSLGGIEQAIHDMRSIDGFLDWFPDNLLLDGSAGMAIFVIGWLFAGISVIGQPHIMVRFMTLNEPGKMFNARLWYYGWFILFYCMASCVGILSRVYLGDISNFDAELALPTMAIQLLSPMLVGLILAGMFAATMSTTDSLILSCSASLSHDLIPHRVEKVWVLKLITAIMILISLCWALLSSQSVFSLVIMAWSGLASAFAPILLVLVFSGRLTQATAISMLVTGITVAITWRYLGLHDYVYEGMPGILSGLILYLIINLIMKHEDVIS